MNIMESGANKMVTFEIALLAKHNSRELYLRRMQQVSRHYRLTASSLFHSTVVYSRFIFLGGGGLSLFFHSATSKNRCIPNYQMYILIRAGAEILDAQCRGKNLCPSNVCRRISIDGAVDLVDCGPSIELLASFHFPLLSSEIGANWNMPASFGIAYVGSLSDKGDYILLVVACLLAVGGALAVHYLLKNYKSKREEAQSVEIEMATPVLAFQRLENDTAVWLCIPSGRGTTSSGQQDHNQVAEHTEEIP